MLSRSAKPSKARSGPGRPRSPAADRAILQAALELFIEHGIDGATIEQIAARAGVARTTLYRRWRSKEALVAQAIAAARGTPEQRGLGNPEAFRRWPRLVVDALAKTLTQPDYAKLVARLIGSVPSCPELMAVYWDRFLLPRRETIGEILKSARAEGLIREDADPELLLDLMGGAIVYHLLVRPGNRTVREMREYLFKLLPQLGLAAGGAAGRARRSESGARATSRPGQAPPPHRS
jgi:AcrR family transcriptional regulator